MLTPWGEALDKNAVLQEYPRPQLVRESYYNLNGLWDYAITASDACPGAWDGEILVPFSPEAPLSGVGRILKPGQVLWYRRTLPFAKPDGGRILLHIGAADQRAWVYVNGLLAGTHTGGYTAFTLDMTKLLRDGENILTVAVRDDTDAVPLSRGKQKTAYEIKFGDWSSDVCSSDLSFFLSASTGGRISSSTMAAARKMDGVGTVFTTPRST